MSPKARIEARTGCEDCGYYDRGDILNAPDKPGVYKTSSGDPIRVDFEGGTDKNGPSWY